MRTRPLERRTLRSRASAGTLVPTHGWALSVRALSFEYAESGNKQLFQISYHKEACRALAFSADGAREPAREGCGLEGSQFDADLYSGSADNSIGVFDLAQQKLSARTDEKSEESHG
jgi:hypothetical protein